MWLQVVGRIWGLHTTLIGKEEGRKGTYGNTNDFRKDKWTFRKIDGRYDHFVTMCR